MDNLPNHVVIPAAGESARYRAAGYTLPKGLIRFKWKDYEDSMINHILRNNIPQGHATVVCRNGDYNMFQKRLSTRALPLSIMSSEGQAHTVYQGIEYYDKGTLLVVNCDNAFDIQLSEFVSSCQHEGAAVGAVVFKSDKENKYGYVDKFPFFDIGVEKEAISEWALAGAFYFESLELFRSAFRHTHRTACYISELFRPVNGKKLAYEIKRDQLHEWGTPEDLKADKTVELI